MVWLKPVSSFVRMAPAVRGAVMRVVAYLRKSCRRQVLAKSEKKTILITGASRGIGAATALLAARKGYAVAINYASNADAAQAVVQQINTHGGTALAVQADVADEAQVLAMFAAVDAQFGRLDALVNNAGVVDVTSRVEDMGLARLKRMFDINILGSFLCAREAVRRMSKRHGGAGGSIVNVSSAAARLGAPGQYVDY
eukprot:gene11571-14726_t